MKPENVVPLRHREEVQQNAEPIATIYRNLGTASAEQVVTRALGEVALTMAGIADRVRSRDLEDMARRLRKLQQLAENLGMVSLSRVSSDVRSCLERGDATAFAAVWARLIRIAERSLAIERELMDQTHS